MTHNRARNYVCDKLSEMGWNVEQMGRNEGVHIRCTGEDGRRMGIRAHGCNGRNAISTPATMPGADFWVIVRFDADPPKCYILSHAEIASERYAQTSERTGETQWWIDPPQYERFTAGVGSIGQWVKYPIKSVIGLLSSQIN